MFSAKTYTERRPRAAHEDRKRHHPAPGQFALAEQLSQQRLLLPAGLLVPLLFRAERAVGRRRDRRRREEALYGDDFTVEDIIWTGPQPTLREMGAGAGVTATFPMAELEKRLRRAISLGRRVHYLPPYRGETKLQLSALLASNPRCCTTTSRWT